VAVVCEYDEPTGGDWPSNIIDFEVKRQISEPYARTAYHDIPNLNGRITQSLGTSHFVVTLSGYYVGETLADAITAYGTLIATMTGIKQNPSVTVDAAGCRLDFNVAFTYDTEALVTAYTLSGYAS
jgi:hypothetical protein